MSAHQEPVDGALGHEFLSENIRDLVGAELTMENSRIEADLLTVPGVYVDISLEEADALRLEVIYQQIPGADAWYRPYRGIAQNGKMIIDHRPEMGPIHLEVEG